MFQCLRIWTWNWEGWTPPGKTQRTETGRCAAWSNLLHFRGANRLGHHETRFWQHWRTWSLGNVTGPIISNGLWLKTWWLLMYSSFMLQLPKHIPEKSTKCTEVNIPYMDPMGLSSLCTYIYTYIYQLYVDSASYFLSYVGILCGDPGIGTLDPRGLYGFIISAITGNFIVLVTGHVNPCCLFFPFLPVFFTTPLHIRPWQD